MLVALVGLAGAFVYGSADFLGGLAARRVHPVLATAIAGGVGGTAMLLALPAAGGTWSEGAVLWGALSGVAGAIAIALLYACLAIGPMSILSPLTAVVSAIVPMSVGLANGEAFGWVGYAGLGLALVAVVLVGFIPEKGAVRPSIAGLSMAVASGILIGVFLIMLDRAPDDSGVIPLLLNRAVNVTLMSLALVAIVVAARRRGRSGAASLTREVPSGQRRQVLGTAAALAAICGLVDTAANALLLLGVRLGELSIMSVLTALYPTGTIILAAVVLKERIAPVQVVGLVLAIAAAAMLAVS